MSDRVSAGSDHDPLREAGRRARGGRRERFRDDERRAERDYRRENSLHHFAAFFPARAGFESAIARTVAGRSPSMLHQFSKKRYTGGEAAFRWSEPMKVPPRKSSRHTR